MTTPRPWFSAARAALVLSMSLSSLAAVRPSHAEPPPSQIVPRIIAGRPLSTRNSAIAKVIRLGRDGFGLCTGTLVSRVDVLTAWHCVSKRPSRMRVEVGEELFQVRRVRTHPDASVREGGLLYNDIALLRLRRPAPVQPLAIFRSRPLLGDEPLIIAGYGVDEFGDSGALRQGVTRVERVTEDFVVSVYVAEESDTCSGDSGGPALVPYRTRLGLRYGIVGITSSGTSPDCSLGDVSFYINLQSPSAIRFIRRAAPRVRFR